MSKLLYVIYRKPQKNIINEDKILLDALNKHISPDNIVPNDALLLETDNSLCSIFNPVSTIQIKDTSICLGYSPDDYWNEINRRGDEIDGSFAIFRNNDNTFQVVNDMVASRTIWYYFDEDVFISSTSQRAIIAIIGSFEFNENVIPWMLSSGTIGPGFSYDKRIKIMGPNSIITLDKYKWKLNVDKKEIYLSNKYSSIEEAKNALNTALEQTFNKLEIDNNKYVLPLSGGYDSRAIFIFLKNKKGLKTITWGVKESQFIDDNDACIAKQLSKKYDVENLFFESYKNDLPIKDVLNRFIDCSEGRIDHLGGYMDGLKMWKDFFEIGFETIIRGDELIGLNVVKSKFQARREEGLSVLSDFYNIDSNIISKLMPQKIDDNNLENIYYYKGKLAIENEHPIIFAALNDIKSGYVEVFNPLLSSSILKVIFNMFDDKIIGNKKIFKKIINELCPDIPIAKTGANIKLNDVFTSMPMKEELIRCFKNVEDDCSIIKKDLANFVITKLKPNGDIRRNKKSKTQIIKEIFPQFLIEIIKSKSIKNEMNWYKFAFRLYILLKANDMYLSDSKIKNNFK